MTYGETKPYNTTILEYLQITAIYVSTQEKKNWSILTDRQHLIKLTAHLNSTESQPQLKCDNIKKCEQIHKN